MTVPLGIISGNKFMSYQPRVAKILAALLVSMTTGAVVLMVLGGNHPYAGPFSLSSYYRLNPIDDAVSSRAPQTPYRWNRIEIYYSGTKAGNIQQLASLGGLQSEDDLNCHFVICNGFGGDDGQIQSTAKWLAQWSVIPNQTWYGTGQTIRICLIGDNKTFLITDAQAKRTDALVDYLAKKFNISAKSIYYPGNWQQ
jgi:hypothetical protein